MQFSVDSNVQLFLLQAVYSAKQCLGSCCCRCIMFLLFLVVCGVIALVVVKVVKPNQKAIQAATASITPDSVSNFTQAATGALQTAINTVTRHRHRRALLLLYDGSAAWHAWQQKNNHMHQEQHHVQSSVAGLHNLAQQTQQQQDTTRSGAGMTLPLGQPHNYHPWGWMGGAGGAELGGDSAPVSSA